MKIEGWIARDKDGTLVFSEKELKPFKECFISNDLQDWELPKDFLPDLTFENSPRKAILSIELL